jgi:hypothetical protein
LPRLSIIPTSNFDLDISMPTKKSTLICTLSMPEID